MDSSALASSLQQHISNGQRDRICYHHFSFTFDPVEVGDRFKDVRFVLVAGCSLRAEAQAQYLKEKLFNGKDWPTNNPLERLTKPTSRFMLFKIGPVLVSNHGMGPASLSIALHELLLMCQQAEVIQRVTFIRFGTCGGIGVSPGTICITNRALDSMFQEFIELKICLKIVRRSSQVDQKTAVRYEQVARECMDAKHASAREELGEFEVKMGATVATNDFYEEQGRTNGAICEHSQEDKMHFLQEAKKIGVINMEMESNYMASMCNKLGISFAVVCVALTNRLLDDKVNLSRDEMSLFERRLFYLNSIFIKRLLLEESH